MEANQGCARGRTGMRLQDYVNSAACPVAGRLRAVRAIQAEIGRPRQRGSGGGAVGESLHDGAAVAINLGGGTASHPGPPGLQDRRHPLGESIDGCAGIFHQSAAGNPSGQGHHFERVAQEPAKHVGLMDALVQKRSAPGLRRIQDPRHRHGQIAQGEIMAVSLADKADGPDGRFAQEGPHAVIGRKQALREGLHVRHAVLGNR